MARKTTGILGKGEALEVNGIVLRRIENVSLGTNLANDNIMQMADGGVVERKSNVPDISVKVEANDIGYVGNFMLLAGNRDANWKPVLNSGFMFTLDSTGMSINADSTVGFDTNSNPEVVVRYAEFNDATLSRSAYVQGMFVNSYEFRAAIDGLATETFNLGGDNKIDFDGTQKDVRVIIAKPGVGTSVATWSSDYADFSSGYTYIKTFVNRVDVYTIADSTVDFSGKTVTIPTQTFDGTERVIVLISKDTAAAFPALSDTNQRAGLRRGSIVISVHNTTTAETKAVRCQNISGTLNLNRIVSAEMGTKRDVDRVVSYPVIVKCDLTFNDNDLELMKDMVNNTAGTSVDANNYVNTMVVTADYYKSEVDHTPANLLKRIIMSGMKVSSENADGRAGANLGTHSYSLEGNNFIMSGTGVDPFAL